jgi:hypothetical protein
MMARGVLASSHARPGNGDGGFPLDEADHLGHGVLRGNRDEHGYMIRPHVALCNPTCLVLGSHAKDVPEMPPQCVLERFAMIRRDKPHMILAVPRGMA